MSYYFSGMETIDFALLERVASRIKDKRAVRQTNSRIQASKRPLLYNGRGPAVPLG